MKLSTKKVWIAAAAFVFSIVVLQSNWSILNNDRTFYTSTITRTTNPLDTSSSRSSNSSSSRSSSSSSSSASWRPRIEESTEPRVILHVGPHKTGTSSFQEFIFSHHDYLFSDKLVFPRGDEKLRGRFRNFENHLNFAHCMIKRYTVDNGNIARKQCKGSILPHLNVYLNQTYHQGKDILLSAEDLDRSEIDYDRIRSSLKPYKQIYIVMQHRPIFEWVKSWYDEIINLYLTTYLYSQNNARVFPSLMHFLKMNPKGFKRDADISSLHRRYEQNGFPVVVLPWHTEKARMERLFCEIDKRSHTCQAIKNGTIKEAHDTRSSQNFLHELYRWEYMTLYYNTTNKFRDVTKHRKKVNKKYLMERMKEHNITVFKDVPLQRLNQPQIDQLWNRTVKEQNVFSYIKEGEHFSHLYETIMDGNYWKALRDDFEDIIYTKYYSIDIENSAQILHSLLDHR